MSSGRGRGRSCEQWAGPRAELCAWAGPWACRERSGWKQRQGSSRHAASGHAPPCPGASTDFHVSQVTQRPVTGRGSQWEGTRPTVCTQRGLVSEWKFSTQAGCSHRGDGVLFTHEHSGHLSKLGVSERCTARHPGQGGGETPGALTEECAGRGPATPQTVSAFVSTRAARGRPAARHHTLDSDHRMLSDRSHRGQPHRLGAIHVQCPEKATLQTESRGVPA